MKKQNANVGLNKAHVRACLKFAEGMLRIISALEKSLKSKDPLEFKVTSRMNLAALDKMAAEFQKSFAAKPFVAHGIIGVNTTPLSSQKITALFSGRKAC